MIFLLAHISSVLVETFSSLAASILVSSCSWSSSNFIVLPASLQAHDRSGAIRKNAIPIIGQVVFG